MNRFEKLIINIAQDNALPLVAKELWPKFIDEEYISNRLNDLNEEEFYSFCCGDADSANFIVKKYKLQDIYAFTNSIFDGYLSDFYYAPGISYPDPPKGYVIGV